jgi:hypothetical protein
MVDITLGTAVIFIAAFVYELIDSSLGQGYGTLGSPTYILLGYDPKLIVPAVLLSQACGGLVNTYWHQYWGNADFWKKPLNNPKKQSKNNTFSPDTKQALIIVVAGIVAAALAAYLGVKLTGNEITNYMGILVLAIGLLVLSGWTFKFTWKKMVVVGIFSAANKSLTGGGYGPVTCGGQVVCGTEGKRAVAITNLAEVPICVTGFIIWMLMKYTPEFIPILAPMAVGAGLGAIIGPYLTYRTPPTWFKYVLGIVFVLLGLAVLAAGIKP